jgi:predicted dehydrogenase
MTNKVRWAILGAGKIAHAFVHDIAAIKNAELVAVAAGDKSRAQAFASEYNLPGAYNYSELYKSDDVDAVYIATTHNFHYEQCVQCIEHGKHVLCEKPITLNNNQFAELARLSQKKQVFLMEGMWTWFLPAVITAKQWLQAGKIGDLKVIEAVFGFPMEKNFSGRMYNKQLAGGALLDLGVYPIALSTYFLNKKPDTITASGVLTETGVDERTGIVLQYGDVTASLFTSMVNIMTNKAFLYGEKGYIEIPEFFRAPAVLLYDDHHNLIEKFEDPRVTKGYHYQIQHATDSILQGKTESDVIPHSSSYQIQEIMTEVRRQIGLVYPGEETDVSNKT